MRRLLFAILFSVFFLAPPAHSQEEASDVMVVTAPTAQIYATPDTNRRTATVLNRGRRVQVVGPEQNGFIPVSTRAGGRAWIRAADVEPEGGGDAYEPAPPPPPRRRATPYRLGESGGREETGGGGRSRFGLHRITFDLGASAGSAGDTTYTEANLGLNIYFIEWLAWRNAVFGRFMSGAETLYGLDSSIRFILSADGGALGFTAFAGPGYRFVNQGENVAFSEAGLVLRLAGIAIGGGVKTLMTSWVTKGAPNDTQYFLILAGGGSL